MYTIADLPIDNRLRTVQYDLELESALRRTFENGYTQVGVERDGQLVGIVTYRSVVRTLLAFHQLDVGHKTLDKVSVGAAVEDAHTVSEDEPVLAVFDALAEHTYIVVDRGEGWHILTDYDLLTRLKRMLEPFLLIESIEMRLREILGRAFGDGLSEELAATFDEDHPLPTPASVDHCSYAHYAQFISIHWAEFEPIFDDQQDVIRELVLEIGDMRNRLFHFRIDDPEEFDRDLLRFGQSYFSSV
ncbi:CBS domain-containing protein [Halorubrum californiense DSM 19288]|uniref:CBS domain-containing protein n=1 Tax=Halorubrum californiense DSM 19288 TaxID=1227465 RepID=M0E7R3_9EURY|nr:MULTISPECIES: CBS domain-containing protein [Halorubrum]ELZ42957.1 CBS domain-containing protein [Halorubrum californiense DSM 19288]TKX68809.1 CBS domain-containing protein [Halorubrum sp. GN11GM_10-3_MGM]